MHRATSIAELVAMLERGWDAELARTLCALLAAAGRAGDSASVVHARGVIVVADAELNPEWQPLALLVACGLVARQELPEAEALLRHIAALGAGPCAGCALLGLSWCALQHGELAEAASLLDEAAQRGHLDPGVLAMARAELATSRGDSAVAEAAWRDALAERTGAWGARDPLAAIATVALARHRLDAGAPREAIAIAMPVRSDPQLLPDARLRAALLVAEAERALGRQPEARQAGLHALALAVEHAGVEATEALQARLFIAGARCDAGEVEAVVEQERTHAALAAREEATSGPAAWLLEAAWCIGAAGGSAVRVS